MLQRRVSLLLWVFLAVAVAAPATARADESSSGIEDKMLELGATGSDDLDDECAYLGETWVPRVLGDYARDDAVTALTGCWQDDDGDWFYPEGYDDPRFDDGPILSDREWRETRSIRVSIEDQLAEMEGRLPGWMGPALDDIGDDATEDGRPLPGPGPSSDNPDVGNLEGQYGDELMHYLRDPDAVELGAFVSWWYETRVAAVPPDLLTGWTADVVIANLQLDRWPWPWELRDEVTTAGFLRWAIDHGYIDS